jgi:hypothetical protein
VRKSELLDYKSNASVSSLAKKITLQNTSVTVLTEFISICFVYSRFVFDFPDIILQIKTFTFLSKFL